MPQLDPSHFASQIFWLFVHFAVLYVFLAYIVTPRMRAFLASRENLIQGNLAAAKAKQQEAEVLQASVNQTRRKAREEARQIVEKIKAELAVEMEQQFRGQDEKLKQRLAASEQRLQVARTKAEAEIAVMVKTLSPVVQQKLSVVKS